MPKRVIANVQPNKIVIYLVSDDYIKTCNEGFISLPDDRAIALYLKKATYISILLDTTKRIFGDERITSNETFLSDGNWLWSGDLTYYFGHNHFTWPTEFIEHIRINKFKIPKINKKKSKLLSLITLDIERTVFKENWGAFTALSKLPAQHYEINEL